MPEPILEVIDNFGGGMYTGTAVTGMPDGTSTFMRNVEIRNGRYIGNRRGFLKYSKDLIKTDSGRIIQPITGLCEYNYGGTKKLIVTAGAKVYIYDPSTGAYTDTGVGITAGYTQHFVKFYSYIILYNGVDLPIAYDGTTWTTLSNAPICSIAEAYMGNLFVNTVATPDRMDFSNDYDPTTWSATTQFAVVSESKYDAMKAIRKVNDLNGALAFSENESWTLQGRTVNDFAFYPLAAGVGCTAHETLRVEGGVPIWQDKDGFYSIGENNNAIRMSALDGLWGMIDKTRLSNAWGVIYDPGANRFKQYICGVTLGTGNTKNTHVLVYDFVSNGWRMDTNIPCDILANGKDEDGLDILYGVNNEDGYIYQLYTGNNDNGKAIASSYISYPITFAQTLQTQGWRYSKMLMDIEIWYRSKYDGTLNLMVTADTKGNTKPIDGTQFSITMSGEPTVPTQYRTEALVDTNHFLRVKYADKHLQPINLKGRSFNIAIECNDGNQDWEIYQITCKGEVIAAD